MMIEKITRQIFLSIAALSLLLLLLFSIFNLDEEIEWDSQKFYVVVETNTPGTFNYINIDYGYAYNILDYYAQSLNKELQLIKVHSDRVDHYSQMDSVSFSLIGEDTALKMSSLDKVEQLTDSSQYVMLVRSNYKLPIDTLLRRKRGAVPQIAIKISDILIERVRNDSTFIYYGSMVDAVRRLRNGNLDFVICSEPEARMYNYNYRNISIVCAFPTYIRSCLYVNRRHRAQSDSFNHWLDTFKMTSVYKKLNNRYHSDGYFKAFLKEGFLPPVNAISHYDKLFKAAAENSSFDWRLLAAISYRETKFRSKIVSKGAYGMMQIMKSNADSRGVSTDELFDPKVNIRIAVELLEGSREALNFHPPLTKNQLKIILACYNAGYGHTLDAMRLARKYNENPNSWDVVRKYLYLKAEPEYYGDKECVRSGRFTGGKITAQYVDHVMNQYEKYLNR